LARLEREIAKLERQEARLHDELAANATDFTRVAELDAQLRATVSAREAAEESWLELAY
jgi:ATP-binding cassette subfamily F protein uup